MLTACFAGGSANLCRLSVASLYDSRMLMRRILLGVFALAALTGSVAGCTSEDPGGESLPDGAQLLRDAAAATREITSAHFTLRVDGDAPELGVQDLDGDITKEGESVAAQGTGTVTFGGQLIEVEFALIGDMLYLKGPTGGVQEIPAAFASTVYDPSTVLNPDKGVPKVLESVRNPKTEAIEEVEGVSTYKVTGTADKDLIAALLPGIESDVDITFWLREDGNHQPVKAAVRLSSGATVELTLSDVDKPVTVTKPT